MRLASFNVQNIFQRAKVLESDSDDPHSPTLLMHEFNRIAEKPVYSDEDKYRMLELLGLLELDKSDDGRGAVRLHQLRGRLLSRDRSQVTASGRASWIGWAESELRTVTDQQLWNTARVVAGLDADILAVMEVEGRAALSKFNENLLAWVDGTRRQRERWRFEHIMVIDGNDRRGIDVGIMTQQEYPILYMRSHVHARDENRSTIFSRDCVEFQIRTASGNVIWVLVNHFKSRLGGNSRQSSARRKRQAEQVGSLYRGLVAAGERLIAVVGDLNDSPDSGALDPLLRETDLRDISEHAQFVQTEDLPGTFGDCTRGNKLDYILLSPAMFERVSSGTVHRIGLWPSGRRTPPPWPVLPEMKSSEDSASDHAPIIADIDV